MKHYIHVLCDVLGRRRRHRVTAAPRDMLRVAAREGEGGMEWSGGGRGGNKALHPPADARVVPWGGSVG